MFTAAFLVQELIDVEGDGMADMVFRCIQEMDIDNRMMVIQCVFFHFLPKEVQLECTSVLLIYVFFYGTNTFDIHQFSISNENDVLQLYQHIVLSGGSTMYPGLPSR